jgi:hypothetical protein
MMPMVVSSHTYRSSCRLNAEISGHHHTLTVHQCCLLYNSNLHAHFEISFLLWQESVTCYPMLLVVGHTRLGHILHCCQRVSLSSVSICLYVGDDRPGRTMYRISKYTATGNRDTKPTALHRPYLSDEVP